MSASHTPLSERDQELLSAYLDGALTDREQRALEQRLAHDNALRTELDHLRDTVALVRELPRLKAPRQFTLDPAVYGRRVPWWQRVLPLETALQLSGALGAAASVVIIILAVALSSRNGTKQAEVQPAANEAAFAITNAEPTSLATLLTAEGTSIAYGGEGLFQATMAMQSTFYAGTPVPSATGVPSTTPLVMIPTGTPTPSSGMVAEAQAGLHASPSEEISMADNVPVTEPELAAQPSAAEAPTLPPSSAPSALGAAAQEGAPQNGVPAPPSGSLEGETGAAQAPQIAQSEGGFREGTDNETQVTLAPTNSATRTQPNTPTPRPALDQAMPATEMALPTTPPESPVFSAPGPTEIPAPLEVAQAPPAEGDAFKTGAERRAAEQGQTHNLWWLAGLGAVTLVISAGLFVAGRRKARRA